MIASLGRLVLALLALSASASIAAAQGNTFNPFGNSGYADYREFGTPMLSNNPSLPGQARLNSMPLLTRPRANSFQQYTESLDGDADSTISPGSSAGLPYFEAFRRYDKKFRPDYQPRVDADREFADRIKKRDELYRQASVERDPAKRAELLRQYNRYSLDRTATPGRAKAGAAAAKAKGAKAPATTTNGAPSPYAAPAARRLAPPNPYATRGRTAPPNPSGRAPAPPSTPRTNPTSDSPIGPAPDASTIPVPPPR